MAFGNSERDFTSPSLHRVTTGFEDRWTQPAQAWQKANLLSLGRFHPVSIPQVIKLSNSHMMFATDGGGVRGYWSLLVLNKLMEEIAHIEQALDENVRLDEGNGHSFHPEKYPRYVSRDLSDDEMKRLRKGENADREDFQALNNNRRYLPCHYFDYICGSSTGS